MVLDSISLNEEYYNEEIRCDYLVSSRQKKIWAVELDLLNKLLEVCKKHNIQVVVFAGTLLGAVRHKGFIPWDDDADVCMTRENYNRLLEVAGEEFEDPYFFQTAYTDKEFFFSYARLRNSSTTGIISGHCSPNYNNGIYIDIFVMDGLISDEKKYRRQKAKLKRSSLLFNWGVSSGSSVSKFVRIIRRTIYKILSYSFLVDKYNELLSRYTEESDRLSLITHEVYGRDFEKKYWMYKSDFEDIVELDFETIRVPAPRNYAQILKHTYGDYMVFPPIEERGKWHDGVLSFDPDTPYIEYLREKDNYVNE